MGVRGSLACKLCVCVCVCVFVRARDSDVVNPTSVQISDCNTYLFGLIRYSISVSSLQTIPFLIFPSLYLLQVRINLTICGEKGE